MLQSKFLCYCRIVFMQNHIKEECQLVTVSCPNEGCSEEIKRSQLDDHLQQCQYRRQSYQWCKEEVPYDQQKVIIYNHHKILININKCL